MEQKSMNTNTVELLKECNKGCKMAIESMNQVLSKIDDTNFCELIKEYTKKHKDIEKETYELLNEYGEKESNPSIVTTTFSWVSTEVKTMLDNEDKKIAKIMMDGCNMGIQSISEYINKYTDASKESIYVAKKLVKMEEKFMEKLKEYL